MYIDYILVYYEHDYLLSLSCSTVDDRICGLAVKHAQTATGGSKKTICDSGVCCCRANTMDTAPTDTWSARTGNFKSAMFVTPLIPQSAVAPLLCEPRRSYK
jgi:hypothetical protein